jgi:3-deoxy-D-manno-octulosonic-acid transferase
MALLPLYRALTLAAGPLTGPYLARRQARGKEEAARIQERRGRSTVPRPDGPLIWIHAASVGETVSVLGLIDRLIAERCVTVLITSGTVTSARLMAERAEPRGRVIHQYVPLDHPGYVGAFLDHWRPDLALWVESELWPNLIGAARARAIPMLLLNGRMSGRSFRRWQWAPGTIRPLVGSFDLCLAQDETQAALLRQLGARQTLCVGDLKSAAGPLPVSRSELTRLTRQIGDRPMWLAASTHDGEEAIAAAAHRALQRDLPSLLTLIAPRHPSRGAELAAMLRARGLTVARRSQKDDIVAGTDIYLADTLGELGLFYRLVGIAFIGGSLVPVGGHNPYEAARLDCAILCGPDMSNAANLAHALAAAGALETVDSAETLAAAVGRLVRAPAERDRRAAAALAVADASRSTLDAVLKTITPWLDRIAANAEPVPA